MVKNKFTLRVSFIMWISTFLIIVNFSFFYNYFFGVLNIYHQEFLIRTFSYLLVIYNFIIGIIFFKYKNLISSKFYYFFIIIGFSQLYAIAGLPGNYLLITLYDNFLIDSFANPENFVLFFEAEPSYVAYFIIFLIFFNDKRRGKALWVFFSFFTLSVRTTIISLLIFIKKRPLTLSLIFLLPTILAINFYNLSYPVLDRLKNISSPETMDPSSYIRYVKNASAAKIIFNNKLLGVGPGQYSMHYSNIYLNDYDTRNIKELEAVKLSKSPSEDPYSFLLGLGAEIGLIGLLFFLAGLFFIFLKTSNKYFFLILLLLLFFDYPFGKPFVWIILGYMYEEGQISRNIDFT